MEDRLITSSWLAEDDQAEYSLRPRFLNEYIGQHGVKEHMRILKRQNIEASPLITRFYMALQD